MKLKLGIITFHSVINYGSALQAYAMQEGIAKCGVETELIDYRPGQTSLKSRIKNNWNRIFSLAKWRRYLNGKISAKRMLYTDPGRSARRAEHFADFLKDNFRLSQMILHKEDLSIIDGKYDGYVCGSDQIWNPTYIGHDLSYYLDFVRDRNKKIAYAPSIAVTAFPKEYKEEIQKQMNSFHKISVREKESVNVVRELTGKEAVVVVDPTLLLDKEDWLKIEKAPAAEYTKKPYIFCYFLGANAEYCRYVNRLKELTGYRIVVVTCRELKVFKNYGDIICDDIGPAEFIYLIHHAQYVCTDSFHGTVFSIINERKFFTFRRYKDNSESSENSRVYTLLDMAGCQERLIQKIEDIDGLYEKTPDYEDIRKRVYNCQSKSVSFLNEEIYRVKYSK